MAALAQLLLSDGRFPAGGYAHSGGLEPAVEDGLTLAELRAFLRGRLTAVALPEAVLAVASRRADSLEELLALDDEAEARTPSPPLRVVSRRLGSQLLRTAITVWPEDELLRAYREASERTPRPVAFGTVGRAAGLADEELAQVYLYEDTASVAAAAVRLLPVDAAVTTRMLVDLPFGELAAEAAARKSDVCVHLHHRDLPVSFAPLHELRSLAHARREGRLFAS